MTALFVALEHDIPDFDLYVNGQALSDSEPKLERIAQKLHVTPLMDFFSQNPEEAAAFIEDAGDDPGEFDLPDQTWFAATDGLNTIKALLEHLRATPEALPNTDAVISELNEWQSVLQRAAAHGIRWHLEVDY